MSYTYRAPISSSYRFWNTVKNDLNLFDVLSSVSCNLSHNFKNAYRVLSVKSNIVPLSLGE